jgi:hypothetical protein
VFYAGPAVLMVLGLGLVGRLLGVGPRVSFIAGGGVAATIGPRSPARTSHAGTGSLA